MIKAIIYRSNTGSTKRYADMLSEMTGLNAYTQRDAEKAGAIEKGDEVIYLGWVMAGKIQGFEDCWKKYEVRAVCSVGLYEKSDAVRQYIERNNIIIDTEHFMLRGALQMQSLKFWQRFIINTLIRDAKRKAAKGGELSENDKAVINAAEKGADYVTKEQLEPVAAWYRGYSASQAE